MINDPMTLILQKDLFTTVLAEAKDFGQCAERLTEMIREIIGVRVVALLERELDGSYVLAGVCPKRRSKLFDDPQMQQLIDAVSYSTEPMLVEPGQSVAGSLLTSLDMDTSFVVPLCVNDEVVGMLLLLDLMEKQGMQRIVDALHELASMLALVIRNAFLYRNMEVLAEQRAKALQKSELRAMRVIESSLDGFVRLSSMGQILEVNGAYCRMSGYTREELLSMRAPQLEAALSPAEVQEKLATIVEGYSAQFESMHRRKNGDEFPVEVSLQYLPGNNDELAAFVRDLSARKAAENQQKKLQDQLLQSQKIESVGQLAGGVAHDFNNMLGVILGHVEMAMDEPDIPDSIRVNCESIYKAAIHSAELTSQLLAFARKQPIQPVLLDLNETVGGFLDMLRRLIGEDIKLCWIPGAQIDRVKMDPSQIGQILTNLCTNSRDAMTEAGQITVSTMRADPPDEELAEKASYVRLSVTDNGSGMSAEVRKHLFEPFFTDKEVGRGTGLGLAMVYGIVKQNNGFIDVRDAEDGGTTFDIYIPQSTEQVSQENKKGAAPRITGGPEIVLLVEDESTILQMIESILKHQGYQVFASSSPTEALLLAEQQETIDLLISDVVMPEMKGKELAEKVLAIHPSMKTLYMSGYTSDIIASHGVIDESVNFIQKPFLLKDFAAKVNQVLERNQ